MKEQDLKDCELCEKLLNSNDFLEYINDMMPRWLIREQNLYLEYRNTAVSPAREDKEKTEFQGGLKMLKRIIKKPNALKEQLKRYRSKSTDLKGKGG